MPHLALYMGADQSRDYHQHRIEPATCAGLDTWLAENQENQDWLSIHLDGMSALVSR